MKKALVFPSFWKMLEWDWAESCLPSRVAEKRAGSGSGSEAVHARWICLVLPDVT